MTNDPSETVGLRPPHTMPGFVRVLVKGLLRSPMHRLVGGNLMLISVTGRVSGRAYTVPLSYVKDGDVITACTSVTNAWPKNLRGGAPVRLLLRESCSPAVAEPVAPTADDLAWYLGRMPRDAKYHHVKLDRRGRPDPEDLKLAAREQLMIRARLTGPSAG